MSVARPHSHLMTDNRPFSGMVVDKNTCLLGDTILHFFKWGPLSPKLEIITFTWSQSDCFLINIIYFGEAHQPICYERDKKEQVMASWAANQAK